MTNFAATVPQAFNGKHNMASDAFQALRDKQAQGEATNSMSFSDLVDTINPLQHIPVVSTFYRELTGDQISNQARIAGGALYGGPIGFVASMVNSAIDLATGNDLGGHLTAGLFDEKPTAATPATQTAANASLVTGSLMPKAPTVAAATPTPAPTPPAPSTATATATATKQAAASTTNPPPALPQLSPEAFNALIGSFADPEAAKKANAALAKTVADQASATTTTATPPATTSDTQGIASKMAGGLNQLDALKTAQAKSLSLSATANGLASASTNSF